MFFLASSFADSSSDIAIIKNHHSLYKAWCLYCIVCAHGDYSRIVTTGQLFMLFIPRCFLITKLVVKGHENFKTEENRKILWWIITAGTVHRTIQDPTPPSSNTECWFKRTMFHYLQRESWTIYLLAALSQLPIIQVK